MTHAEHDHTHVSEQEALEADDPAIGDGTPATAPVRDMPDDDHDTRQWVPTRKWMARTVTALAGLATTVVTTDGWDEEETLMLITIVAAALVAYLVPNDDQAAA